MRADRRAIIVFIVFLFGVMVTPQLRTNFVFGLRLLGGRITLEGTQMVSTDDEENPVNTAIWSLQDTPKQSSGGRNERVGLAVSQTIEGWNKAEADGGFRAEGISPLEDYCKANPDDIKAKAHMVRLALNLPDINGVRDKDRLLRQAERMLAVARECAKKEPDNWYWRERVLHALSLLGRIDEGLQQFTAEPMPKTYHDYASDEFVARRAIYFDQFSNLPDSAIVPQWAGIIFPHLNMRYTQKKGDTTISSLEHCVAKIEIGKALIRDADIWIKPLVGAREIRQGLSGVIRVSSKWKDDFTPKRQAELHEAYLKHHSEEEWKQAIAWANIEVNGEPAFDDVPFIVKVGTLGPVLVAGGFLALLGIGLTSILAWRRVRQLKVPGFAGWLALFVAFLIGNYEMGRWKYLYNYTLAAPALQFLLLMGFGLAFAMAFRRPKEDGRLSMIVMAIVVFLSGFLSHQSQSSGIIILGLMILQRFALPMRAWTSGIAITVSSIHLALGLAFDHRWPQTMLSWILVMTILILFTDHQPDPDQPRIAPIVIPIAAILAGIFLFAQYDKGMMSPIKVMEERTERVKQRFERTKG